MKNIYTTNKYKLLIAGPMLLATVLVPVSVGAYGVGIDGTTKTGIDINGVKVEGRLEDRVRVDLREDDNDGDEDSYGEKDKDKNRDKKDNKNDDKREKFEEKVERKVENDKDIPWGIWKKFFGNWFNWFSKDEVKVDITNPIIKSIEVKNVATSSSVVVWTTDEKTNGKLWYATSTVDTNATSSVTLNDYTKVHTINLDSLSASTTYKYVVKSSDRSGNATTSIQAEFTTK